MTAFHALHVPGTPLLLPNAWEFGFAAFLAAQGFPAIGTTSLGVSAVVGLPDGAPSTRDATVALARCLRPVDALVSVDIADGFSADPGEVAALAVELAEAGAAGVNLEDGRPGGGLAEVRAQSVLIAAIKAAVPGLFVNARTDTHWLAADPPPVAAAVDRARAYADAGADGVFVPGLAEPAAVEELVAAVDLPVNLLFLPGRTTFAGLAELGVARVSLGSLPYRMALGAALDTVHAVVAGKPLPLTPPSYGDVVKLLPEA
ncbi:isocitrate lyase/PEP mutase family protein [Amycolatopsis sp. H20-H5]|uniref:isocitrate lyase/PEP mutase family protein n=1 Tax=Amycolatopsis sp. H20-H5 TaxID=3046309 RepID=UPI002DBCAAF6|nr:isocitrate lyase/phosphoenolpyruvate mutase family protein [Amycolatopsis sp. H20-H5]MEC3977475.1 isocitrate lyase/phosphoenolpyruvate mutase family protein [Amycolatopsis sp. H20-H5]